VANRSPSIKRRARPDFGAGLIADLKNEPGPGGAPLAQVTLPIWREKIFRFDRVRPELGTTRR